MSIRVWIRICVLVLGCAAGAAAQTCPPGSAPLQSLNTRNPLTAAIRQNACIDGTNGVLYWNGINVGWAADGFLSLQDALDACNAAGGGVIYGTPGKSYPTPATGLHSRLNCALIGIIGQTGATANAPTIDCLNVTNGNFEGCVMYNTNGSALIGWNIKLKNDNSGNCTGLRTVAGSYYIIENISFSGGTCSGNAIVDAANRGIMRNVGWEAGISPPLSTGGYYCPNGGGGTRFVYDMKLGTTTTGVPFRLDNCDENTYVNLFIDEPQASILVMRIHNGSEKNRFIGGSVLLGGGTNIDLDSTSHRNVFDGFRILAGTRTTLVNVNSDFNIFNGIFVTDVGAVTNSFLFASGADNNTVSGILGAPISDSGANNTYFGTDMGLFRGGIIASASLNFPSTAAATCSDLTITATGAALGDPVILGVPFGSPIVTGGSYTAWVSAANTVTVRFCAQVLGDPGAGTFNVRVQK